ncbi:hypothetical protein ACM614_29845 [Streptomyces sp. 12297]
MLAELLDDNQRVRSKALDHLHHAVHHQNTLYSATVPAPLYVAAIVASPRTAVPVDKKPHDFPGPLRMELLGWLGSVAREADDETEAISRQHGFAPEDYPPILHVRQIRPLLFLAVSACIDDPDLHVREAAIAACIPLLDDSRLCQHRPTLVTLLKEVLGVSALWRYRERAIDTLAAWGEDSTCGGAQIGNNISIGPGATSSRRCRLTTGSVHWAGFVRASCNRQRADSGAPPQSANSTSEHRVFRGELEPKPLYAHLAASQVTQGQIPCRPARSAPHDPILWVGFLG